MTNQPSLFDGPVVLDARAGEDRKERGHANALGARAFQVRVAAALRVAQRQKFFTTDDVWVEVGSVPEGHDAPSAMGSVMRHLSQTKVIRWTGTWRRSNRPEQHRKDIKVWTRT